MSLPELNKSHLTYTKNIFLPGCNINVIGNSSQLTHEVHFYNNNDFNISFTNKNFLTHNLMAGIENFDEKYSIHTINMFSKKYQDFKKVDETKYFNSLLFLTILFLFKLKLYLDKNRITYLICIGLLKILTSHWRPVDSFYELKYSFNDEFFSLEILQVMDRITLFEIEFDTVIYSMQAKKFVHQPPL